LEKRSTFITVISWLYIVIFGFYSIISVSQLVIYSSLLKAQPDFSQTGFPSFNLLNWEINPLVAMIGLLIINLLVVFSAILLLKRKNFGRIVVSIYNSLFSIFLILQLFLGKSKFDGVFSDDPSLSKMYSSMKVGMTIFSAVLISLSIFIIYMINRKSVSIEFTKPSNSIQDSVVES